MVEDESGRHHVSIDAAERRVGEIGIYGEEAAGKIRDREEACAWSGSKCLIRHYLIRRLLMIDRIIGWTKLFYA